MPAISFDPGFLDAILSGTKCQTTRRQTTRFKEGDTVNAYIQQRKAIRSKPLRNLTVEGHAEMQRLRNIAKKNYPEVPSMPHAEYPAHFLGRFSIQEVYEFYPGSSEHEEWDEWAVEDGFDDFWQADTWFIKHHGVDWMAETWTVVRWDGLFERYFEPLKV